MSSRADRDANLATAGRLVRRAAAAGARLVALPEKWPFVHGPRTREGAEALDGPSLAAAAGWARELGVAVLAGSVIEAAADGWVHNTSVLVGPDGAALGTYRKIHMFDVDVGGVAYRESAATAAGDETVVAEALGRRIGMSVCYDVRFPELYRRLADGGAEVITVPAAFTETTGRDHWEPLLRARAIENQAFVLAPGQHGRHDDGTVSYGRSMIVDPWGVVLAQVPDGEGVAVADLDFGRLEDVRARLPALRHRRL
ncbi:carbon-nitrogen hydrolase family protein [Miltoncostaea marina]|uniref:carbon-nitrogen hydrolase family protein n=1 Tax=Miltoncostaea marina TaxID=2843215 RepID=UPI001C3CD8B8|nr:carbon-nitrogen hydrolase family protein [Miltoncostaea marina]